MFKDIMHRAVLVASLFGMVRVVPVSADEPDILPAALFRPTSPSDEINPAPEKLPDPAAVAPASSAGQLTGSPEPPPWKTAWGVAGVHLFGAGPKVAPNGETYHPYHSLDLDFNLWLWRTQGIYLFSEMRFWNEKPEYNVTNGDDSFLGFSKREFDMNFGAAWNYTGNWEARAYGYTLNNLNRGNNLVTPSGLLDGFCMENRYYLTNEYARLGRDGYDVARADFVSIGYYFTKDLVGNDGQEFKPGLLLRAYLTHDLLWNWPAYVYADIQYISENTMQPKLLLFDGGVALRPFCFWDACSNWWNVEIRFGAENTADLREHSVYNLWYGELRLIF